MIKASIIKKKGGVVLMFGLEPGNIERLKKGMPIHIFTGELIPNSKDEILIFYGESVEAMKKDLEKVITPQTEVRDLRNESLRGKG